MKLACSPNEREIKLKNQIAWVTNEFEAATEIHNV